MPVAQSLVSWVGQTDLDASRGKLAAGGGPLASAFGAMAFSGATLLSNYDLTRVDDQTDAVGIPVSRAATLLLQYLHAVGNYGQHLSQPGSAHRLAISASLSALDLCDCIAAGVTGPRGP